MNIQKISIKNHFLPNNDINIKLLTILAIKLYKYNVCVASTAFESNTDF